MYSAGPGFVIPELSRLALVHLRLAPSPRPAAHQQRPRDKALSRITCSEAGADQAGRLGAAARKTSRPWSSRALPRATSYPGWVGRSQVCASTGRYCTSPESCRSYSHPALHVSARSARLAYPHTAHRFEIDRVPPQSSQGSRSKPVSSYAPYCEDSPSHLSYLSARLPFAFPCVSACPTSFVHLEDLQFTFILQLRTRMPSMCRAPLHRVHPNYPITQIVNHRVLSPVLLTDKH